MRIPAHGEKVLLSLCLLALGCPDDAVYDDDVVATDDDSTESQTDDDCTPSDDDSTPSDDDSTGDDDATPTDDQDGDGWTVPQGDCDDSDASVHPEAEEVPCDAVDNDCDGYGILSGAMLGGVEYATVPHALSAAVDGDTLYVCPGTHVGQLFIDDERSLTITSYSGNRDDTVLDGGGLETVVHIGEDNDVDLSHLTIRNGLAQPWLDGDHAGGGVMSFAVSTRLEDCVFVDNQAPQQAAQGAAVAQYRYLALGHEPMELVVDGCRFDGNDALGDGGRGGAIYAASDSIAITVNLSNSSFSANRVEGEGGAVVAKMSSRFDPDGVDVQIDGCTFEDNEAGYSGGALFIDNWTSLSISNSAFTSNYSDYEGGAVGAWSPKAEPSSFQVTDTTFEDNLAASEGGAWEINIDHDDQSADFCLDTVTFIGNSTDSANGGAIHVNGYGSLSISGVDTQFEWNTAGNRGGAIHADVDGGMTVSISSGSFLGNEGQDSGGAIRFGSSDAASEVEFDDVLFQGNANLSADTGVVVCSTKTTCTMDGCSFLSNSGGAAWISRVGSDSTLVSIDTDWGTGATDNTPHDVQIYEGDTYAAFGANETFTCTAELGCI